MLLKEDFESHCYFHPFINGYYDYKVSHWKNRSIKKGWKYGLTNPLDIYHMYYALIEMLLRKERGIDLK